MIEKFIKWAEVNNWNTDTGEFNIKTLSDEILKRYEIPSEYQQFLMKVTACTNNEQNKWFICIDDYSQKSEGEFRWNEYEIISLDAAETDKEWKKSITEFWNLHFPFFMSVEGEYRYFAINVNNGSVVEGYEPEFEETTTIAKSFYDFLEKVISGELSL